MTTCILKVSSRGRGQFLNFPSAVILTLVHLCICLELHKKSFQNLSFLVNLILSHLMPHCFYRKVEQLAAYCNNTIGTSIKNPLNLYLWQMLTKYTLTCLVNKFSFFISRIRLFCCILLMIIILFSCSGEEDEDELGKEPAECSFTYRRCIFRTFHVAVDF